MSYFPKTSSKDPWYKTSLSAYNNSINEPDSHICQNINYNEK